MERELYMLQEAQRLLRLVDNNLRDSDIQFDYAQLGLIRKDLNEFVRNFQYFDSTVSEE